MIIKSPYVNIEIFRDILLNLWMLKLFVPHDSVLKTFSNVTVNNFGKTISACFMPLIRGILSVLSRFLCEILHLGIIL